MPRSDITSTEDTILSFDVEQSSLSPSHSICAWQSWDINPVENSYELFTCYLIVAAVRCCATQMVSIYSMVQCSMQMSVNQCLVLKTEASTFLTKIQISSSSFALRRVTFARQEFIGSQVRFGNRAKKPRREVGLCCKNLRKEYDEYDGHRYYNDNQLV